VKKRFAVGGQAGGTFNADAMEQNMATNTGLSGPYRLTFDAIDAAITQRAPGVFALGRADSSGRFCVNYVGRADGDIRVRLRDFIGSDTLFKYGYTPTLQAAFERECELFHDVRPPRSLVHPGRPKGTNWECPRCRIFA
jgi:hypothetical protein